MKTVLSLLVITCLLSGNLNSTIAQDSEKKYSRTDILVRDIDAQKTLVMKAEIPMSAIGTKMGEMYGSIFGYLQTQNIAPAGAPFAIYYSYDPNGNTIFEAGVPVAETVQGNETISYKEFPVTKVVSTVYTGSYENMGTVYAEIQKYLADNKLESTGVTWEVYLTDPSSVSDPSQNQTIIYFPVK